MIKNPYKQAQFLKSAAKVNQLPEDSGVEVAFAGRSNAGKSSALNCLTEQKQLARTSKTPGRTQLINLFTLADENHRLVDLPGYGYAKVPHKVKQDWHKHLGEYLETRMCLKGLVLLMDSRHPLKELDNMLVEWASQRDLPVHILLTKADKLSKNQAQQAIALVKRHYKPLGDMITAQAFSSLKKHGVDTLITQLNNWFDYED